MAILAIGFVVAIVGVSTRTNMAFGKLPMLWSLSFFGLAVAADLVTTIYFFHVKGIIYELHPGVRLFGYAYGRTVGPILGKAVQALGVLAIASLLGSRGGWLTLAVGAIYLVAAIYNVSH